MNTIDIQRKICHLFGRKIINSNDCNELSDSIYIKIQKHISSQTLKRFFNIIKDGTKPSPNTIIILNEYISKLDNNYLKNKNLFEREIKFILDFYSIELYDQNDFNYQLASANIAKKIYDSEFILNQVFQKLAETKAGQIYFFERFPFEDLLQNKTYQSALNLYTKKKKSIEANIYATSLLLKGYYLSKQKLFFFKKYLSINNIMINDELHPFVKGRYFANKIMYCDLMNQKENTITVIKKAKDYILAQSLKSYFPFFEYIIIEALILTKHYEYIELFSDAFKKVENVEKLPIESGYYESLKVFEIYYLIYQNDFKIAKSKLNQLKSAKILFFQKKYFSILVSILKVKMNIDVDSNKKLLKQIIADTNYSIFNNF